MRSLDPTSTLSGSSGNGGCAGKGVGKGVLTGSVVGGTCRVIADSLARGRSTAGNPGGIGLDGGAVLHDAGVLPDAVGLHDSAALHSVIVGDGVGSDGNTVGDEDSLVASIFGLVGKGMGQKGEDLIPLRHHFLDSSYGSGGGVGAGNGAGEAVPRGNANDLGVRAIAIF